MSDNDQPTTPTGYDMREGFGYHSFQFSDDFPIPMAYVVAYGMAHFRGPDTYLWFAVDGGFGVRDIDWGHPQNVAEFDRRQDDGDDAYHTHTEYQATIADLCRALDALIAADHRYHQWCMTLRTRRDTTTCCTTCGREADRSHRSGPMPDPVAEHSPAGGQPEPQVPVNEPNSPNLIRRKEPMTSTASSAAASSADPPGSDEPASTEPATPASLLRQEAAVRRHLTHILGVELRRRLIPLVRANLMPLDVACGVLQGAGLAPLPRMWMVQLAPVVTRRGSSTSVDQAITAFRHDLDRAAKDALGDTVTIAYPQPPTVAGTPDDGAGSVRYDISGDPVLTASVRAETRHQAQARTVDLLRAALAALPGVEADLNDPGAMYTDPAPHLAVELDVDTDAPYQPFPPPGHNGQDILHAETARRLALQTWRHQVRRIRAGLISTLVNGDLDDRPGTHGPYGLVDDLLRELGLPGLPHAHLYEVTATIPVTVTVTAADPLAARRAAHGLIRDAFAFHPQYGLPITCTNTFRELNIAATGDGSYRVSWPETYLVCLRATHSPRLAESAVRLQLSVLTHELPDVATIPLTTEDLGEYIDHRLDPDRD